MGTVNFAQFKLNLEMIGLVRQYMCEKNTTKCREEYLRYLVIHMARESSLSGRLNSPFSWLQVDWQLVSSAGPDWDGHGGRHARPEMVK